MQVDTQTKDKAEELCKSQIARNIKTSDKKAIEELIDESIGLKISAIHEDEFKTYEFNVCQIISRFDVKHNAVTGQFVSYFFDALMDQKKIKFSEEECLRIAIRTLDRETGAVMDSYGFEKHGGYEVFIARWRHEHESILVEGDFIHVLINGRTGKVISVVKKWHEVDVQYSER